MHPHNQDRVRRCLIRHVGAPPVDVSPLLSICFSLYDLMAFGDVTPFYNDVSSPCNIRHLY